MASAPRMPIDVLAKATIASRPIIAGRPKNPLPRRSCIHASYWCHNQMRHQHTGSSCSSLCMPDVQCSWGVWSTRDGSRTRKLSRAADFKSADFASLSTRARRSYRSGQPGEPSQAPGTMSGMPSTARPPRQALRIIDEVTGEPETLSSGAYAAYAYLLGLYLGDGDITSHARGVFARCAGRRPSLGRQRHPCL